MAIYEIAKSGLRSIPVQTFSEAGFRERQDLQQWLRTNPAALGEDLLIISEEFGEWADSKRRIDLLAIDKQANLVVVEIKRTEDGGHMDLQAIRYAAMVSAMSFEDVVQAYSVNLQKYEPREKDTARQRILLFLGLENSADNEIVISNTPHILLVSANFNVEITTTVLWLIDLGLSIRCLQVALSKIGETYIVDLRQVIPLAQAVDYQVRMRKKGEVAQQASNNARRELTMQVLIRHGIIKEGTEIEVVPEALPPNHAALAPELFRARIIDPTARASVVWLNDSAPYSPTKLTNKLSDEHGLIWLANNIFMHWRVVGHVPSMWDEAENLARN